MKSFLEYVIHEGTSASDRGEPQTPHTDAEYQKLSPANKKLIDARVKAARKQSDSRNPSESPRNYKKRKPKTRRGGVSKYGRGQAGPLPKNEETEIDEAIWAKNVGQDAIRQIRAATPPYTVVAIKGKKVVAQSKPIMVSNQVPAFLHDFVKDNSDEALTIGVEDKYGKIVYTYHRALKGRGVRREETEIDEGIVILPKRSSRGGDVKEVGKDKRGGKTQYWWRHKNGLKNVYDSLEKLRYALRNDANFKDAEEITKQLGEAVNEGGMGRMKDPYTIRYVDPKQKDTTNISVVDGEQEAKKFLAKVKKKGMSGTIKKGSEQPGSIQTVKYNQSTDQLNKASRYDTLTGRKSSRGQRRNEYTPDHGEELGEKDDVLLHSVDKIKRTQRRFDKAAERRAKTKRSFGPQKNPKHSTMAVALQKALDNKK